MKSFIILNFLFFISVRVWGQVDYTVSYHPSINKAELSIVDGDYKKALSLYELAFKKVPTSFAKDFFNATICAIKIKQYKSAFKYCDSLMAKGVNKNFFSENNSLHPLRETKKWRKYIEQFDNKYVRFNSIKDTSLKNLFSKMEQQDQEFRKKPGSYVAYRDTIEKIDSLNIAILKSVIANNGFPNENMVPVKDPTFTTLPANIVFHHHCQSMSKDRKGKYNFKDEFIAAVQKGQLDPHRFAFLLSLQGESNLPLGGLGITQCEINGVRSKLLGEKYPDKAKKIINNNRVLYGLETLDDYYRKAVFAIREDRSKEFAFKKYRNLNLFEMATEEQCEKFILASEIIE
jgi:hypothetical protein